jgi:transglutaminase-like putative cysteine protease
MKRVAIHHTTRYEFSAPVRLGPHRLFVRPREGHDVRIVASSLIIDPKAAVTWRRDFYDNVLAVASFDAEQANTLTIDSHVEVELYETMPLDFIVEAHAVRFPFAYDAEEQSALAPFLAPIYPDGSRLTGWIDSLRAFAGARETFEVLDRINQCIHVDLDYQLREEEGVLAPEETLQRGAGSCRDLATLYIETCRRLGIAARFVSGYVHGPATEAGGASTHAWAEVYLPGAGWKGFDPTNQSVVGPDHVPVAVHRNPLAIPPVSGRFTGPANVGTNLLVDVQIKALQ